MAQTSTARVLKFQARQKAGRIVVSVEVDLAKFAKAAEDREWPLSDSREAIQSAAQEVIDEFCGDRI